MFPMLHRRALASQALVLTQNFCSAQQLLWVRGAELGDSWSDGADPVTAPKIADKPPRER